MIKKLLSDAVSLVGKNMNTILVVGALLVLAVVVIKMFFPSVKLPFMSGEEGFESDEVAQIIDDKLNYKHTLEEDVEGEMSPEMEEQFEMESESEI